MTDNIIQFGRQPDGSDGGYGEIFATVHLYENGYYIDPIEGEVTAAFRQTLRDRMFRTLATEAEAIFTLTGEVADMPVYFAMIFGNGRITHWPGDHLESLTQVEWTARMLRGMGADLLRSHTFKAYIANDNPQEPTA